MRDIFDRRVSSKSFILLKALASFVFTTIDCCSLDFFQYKHEVSSNSFPTLKLLQRIIAV